MLLFDPPRISLQIYCRLMRGRIKDLRTDTVKYLGTARPLSPQDLVGASVNNNK